MAFDIGYGRDEINTENHGISYANNQQHVVTIHITERGRHIKMQVSNVLSNYFQVSLGSCICVCVSAYIKNLNPQIKD